MGGGDPKPQRRIAPETGHEPHFHVNDCTFEVSSDGTILVTAYEEVHGEFRVAFFATVVPANLIRMAKAAMQAGSEAHNLGQFQAFIDEGGNTH